VVITARASGDEVPRSITTKRRTLAYRAVKPWSSTSRAESVDIAAAFGGPESVDTSTEIAGFGFDSLGRPRRRTAIPAASGNRRSQRPQVRESCRPFPRLFLRLRRVRFATEDDFDVVYIAGLGQRNGVGIN
jgi:hypothetical protein